MPSRLSRPATVVSPSRLSLPPSRGGSVCLEFSVRGGGVVVVRTASVWSTRLVAIVVVARVTGAWVVVSTRLGAGAGAHTAQTKACPLPFAFLTERPLELKTRLFSLPSVSSRQPYGCFFWATARGFVDVNFNSFAAFSQS